MSWKNEMVSKYTTNDASTHVKKGHLSYSKDIFLIANIYNLQNYEHCPCESGQPSLATTPTLSLHSSSAFGTLLKQFADSNHPN